MSKRVLKSLKVDFLSSNFATLLKESRMSVITGKIDKVATTTRVVSVIVVISGELTPHVNGCMLLKYMSKQPLTVFMSCFSSFFHNVSGSLFSLAYEDCTRQATK